MNDMHVDRNGTEVISKKAIFDGKLCLSNICTICKKAGTSQVRPNSSLIKLFINTPELVYFAGDFSQ